MTPTDIGNRRACLGCKDRKVRCDRVSPCNNCSQLGWQCQYPQSRIRRRRNKAKSRNSEAETYGRKETPPRASPLVSQHRQTSSDTSSTCMPGTIVLKGYLVIGEGYQSRMLAQDSWANVKEVKDLSKSLLRSDDSPRCWPTSIDADYDDILSLGRSSSFEGWVPSPAQLQLCWYIYVDNVDPIIRILHKPSMLNILAEAQKQPMSSLGAPVRARLLAICFAAIQSLEPHRCLALFGESVQRVTAMSRRSLLAALSQARLMETHDICVLQAFTLFLACCPRDGSSYTWTLVGLALRIATSLGLHRDGLDHSLPPFEVEMRRRLWWEICALNVRTSEDRGAVAGAHTDSNTRLPLSIMDSDLDPSAETCPVERDGPTEMLFSIMRFDVCSRRAPLFTSGTTPVCESISNEGRGNEELKEYMARNYSMVFAQDKSLPFFRLAGETSRMLQQKLDLQAYFNSAHRDQWRRGKHAEIEVSNDASQCDKLFQLAVTLLEDHAQLMAESAFSNWKWYLHQLTQWHAVSFVLSQLRGRVDGVAERGFLQLPIAVNRLPENLGRAWRAVESVITRHENHSQARGSYSQHADEYWGPLHHLRQQVERKLDLDDHSQDHLQSNRSGSHECAELGPIWDQDDFIHLDATCFPGIEQDGFSIPWSTQFQGPR